MLSSIMFERLEEDAALKGTAFFKKELGHRQIKVLVCSNSSLLVLKIVFFSA